ncbi:hypothetical protein Hypma_007438 [Hypsizygus marmoreus]|uniref:Uncharacterized protein n=1 Tax=Hypsizygus marmoreus TaxID=39966 RepID=A0A369JZ46_HYPMA|nr:hypothetical protein Hypma_007438 [Hypsizygus marmoreus]
MMTTTGTMASPFQPFRQFTFQHTSQLLRPRIDITSNYFIYAPDVRGECYLRYGDLRPGVISQPLMNFNLGLRSDEDLQAFKLDERHSLLALVTRYRGDVKVNLKLLDFNTGFRRGTKYYSSLEIPLTTEHQAYHMDCMIAIKDAYVGVLITFSLVPGHESDHQLVVYNWETKKQFLNLQAKDNTITSFSFLPGHDLKMVTTGYGIYGPRTVRPDRQQQVAFIKLWCLKDGKFQEIRALELPLCSPGVRILRFQCTSLTDEYLKPDSRFIHPLLRFELSMWRLDTVSSPSLSVIIGVPHLIDCYSIPQPAGRIGRLSWGSWGLHRTLVVDTTHKEGRYALGGHYFAVRIPRDYQSADVVSVYQIAIPKRPNSNKELAVQFDNGAPAFAERIFSSLFRDKMIWSALKDCHEIFVHCGYNNDQDRLVVTKRDHEGKYTVDFYSLVL